MISVKLKSEGEKEIYFMVLCKRKENERQNDFFFNINNDNIINIYNKYELNQKEGFISTKKFLNYLLNRVKS